MDSMWRTSIAKKFIYGKIHGMINVARYYVYKDKEYGRLTHEESSTILERIKYVGKTFDEELENVHDTEELRKIEAKWSRELWRILGVFIPEEYGFTGRNPRSRDPINSAMSYAYAIIYTLYTHALISAGLDPYVGIMHSEKIGKKSLTYDYSEMFKPVAIHSTIKTARKTKLQTDNDGYLTTQSLQTITQNLYKNLRRKQKQAKYTIKGEIYAKAWQLRQNIEKATKYKPYVYKIK